MWPEQIQTFERRVLSGNVEIIDFYFEYTKLYARSPVVSLGIFSEATDGTMCPGVDSVPKNEYQENSWG
jgi:hypothetical protein